MLDAKFKMATTKKVFERFIARNILQMHLMTLMLTKMSATLGDTKTFPQNFAYFLSVQPTDFAPVVESLSGDGIIG